MRRGKLMLMYSTPLHALKDIVAVIAHNFIFFHQKLSSFYSGGMVNLEYAIFFSSSMIFNRSIYEPVIYETS